MTTKKLAIIGRGTVGCISVADFLHWTDWEIEWHYDPETPPSGVGEGTTAMLPNRLHDSIVFSYEDLLAVGGTTKRGINKIGWSGSGDYMHNFALGLTGVHFSAEALQKFLFEHLSDCSSVRTIEGNTSLENIDSDFIMDCSGRPELDDSYELMEYTITNACLVAHCSWDSPRFDYTKAIAMPHGWIFVIPLQARCSFGYVHNSNITNISDIENGLREVVEKHNLEPYATPSISFANYKKKINFTERVAFNGNKSFFVDPMEATSTTTALGVNSLAYDMWSGIKGATPDACNAIYSEDINEIEAMISMHYLKNPGFDTEFWNNATYLAEEKLWLTLKGNPDFRAIVDGALHGRHPSLRYGRDVGTWNLFSFSQNVHHLNIATELHALMPAHEH